MAELLPGQGYVGYTAPGVVELEDDDPRTEGAKAPEAVSYEVEDEDVATVTQHATDPLQLTVTLVGSGTTRVLCHVDPGEGDPFHFSTDVEALPLPPGEARTGTFVLGAFVELPA